MHSNNKVTDETRKEVLANGDLMGIYNGLQRGAGEEGKDFGMGNAVKELMFMVTQQRTDERKSDDTARVAKAKGAWDTAVAWFGTGEGVFSTSESVAANSVYQDLANSYTYVNGVTIQPKTLGLYVLQHASGTNYSRMEEEFNDRTAIIMRNKLIPAEDIFLRTDIRRKVADKPKQLKAQQMGVLYGMSDDIIFIPTARGVRVQNVTDRTVLTTISAEDFKTMTQPYLEKLKKARKVNSAGSQVEIQRRYTEMMNTLKGGN